MRKSGQRTSNLRNTFRTLFLVALLPYVSKSSVAPASKSLLIPMDGRSSKEGKSKEIDGVGVLKAASSYFGGCGSSLVSTCSSI